MPSGTITNVEGPARVQTESGQVRDAEQGSRVNPGDRIITGRGAEVEVSDTSGHVTHIEGKGTYEVPEGQPSRGSSVPVGVVG